jgi:hypothetical protein
MGAGVQIVSHNESVRHRPRPSQFICRHGSGRFASENHGIGARRQGHKGMGLKKRVKSLARDVLAELALNYRVQNVLEPQHPAGIWGISFVDRYAPRGHRVFLIGVGPVDEATLSLTKTELLAKLAERCSICCSIVLGLHPFLNSGH